MGACHSVAMGEASQHKFAMQINRGEY